MKTIINAIVFLCLIFASCAQQQTLTKTVGVTAGADCPNGGTWVYSGVDDNDNGALDDSEVDSSELVCNEVSGHSALVVVTEEPAGGDCLYGGQRIQSGIDVNDNSILEAIEITTNEFVCNGSPGVSGTDGTDGTDGVDGTDGTGGAAGGDGADGLTALVHITNEPAGANCEAGGKKVETGLDDDSDGELDASEVDNTDYVCNGSDGISSGSPLVTVSTVAGASEGSFEAGDVDGTPTNARFSNPATIAVNSEGYIYVADVDNNKVKVISPSGDSSTFLVSAAGFLSPSGAAVDSSGNAYIADTDNHKIRKITPAGVVTTLAGSGSPGSDEGAGTAATFNTPYGVAVDSTGNVYVADTSNHKIRKITSDGVVTTLAGSGSPGSDEGTGPAATFNTPYGVAVDSTGNVYVADTSNHKIRKITPAGVVTTLAGSGSPGSVDNTGPAASFNNPRGVAVDSSGNVYVADRDNHKIRKITSDGVVTTLAGSGSSGSDEGTGPAATFNTPYGAAVDSTGNVYVADTSNHKIRKITTAGEVSTLAGGGVAGDVDDTGGAARFYEPNGIAVDSSGDNIYVSDYGNNKIRKISSAGVVTAFTGGLSGSNDGLAIGFSVLNGIAVDPATQNIYVSDCSYNRIFKATPSGVSSLFAGSGATGSTDGNGTAASFNRPYGLEVDSSGNVYVADKNSNKIRKITSAGVVTTLAGSGVAGDVDDTGGAASFNQPHDVAVDSSGNVYVADSGNHKIRKITASGDVSTLAGSVYSGGSDGAGEAASFNQPTGIAVDSSGNLYIADSANHKIRTATAEGVVTTLAGGGGPGADGEGSTDGSGDVASFNNPKGVSVDSSGNVYIADSGNHKIRKITP